MTTLVLFTPATLRAMKEFATNPEKQALIKSPESKKAYREGTERVRRIAAERRALNAVDRLLRFEKITI
jgi:hypothetical protein